ncbi:hypothetical protein [Staphylococcus equorum]|uniref:hypothetical protein n=1 Tax=Staphylococcus equorum TaxID=246432 RepID=UPI000852E3D7|nr:hypothetical protein [Staphylococcus equorum]OEK60574.1 hypothetical protein ASS99_10965 [Staphylococcus equorum]
MNEKTLKIQLEDELIEYKIEDDQSLIIEIKNENNELKITSSENVKRLSNNFGQSYLNSSNYGLYEEDYVPDYHKTSIYDVLNKNVEEERNDLELESVVDENNADSTEVKEDEESKEIELKEKDESHRDERENDEAPSYDNMISNILERFKNEDAKQTNK